VKRKTTFITQMKTDVSNSIPVVRRAMLIIRIIVTMIIKH